MNKSLFIFGLSSIILILLHQISNLNSENFDTKGRKITGTSTWYN